MKRDAAHLPTGQRNLLRQQADWAKRGKVLRTGKTTVLHADGVIAAFVTHVSSGAVQWCSVRRFGCADAIMARKALSRPRIEQTAIGARSRPVAWDMGHAECKPMHRSGVTPVGQTVTFRAEPGLLCGLRFEIA